MARLYDIFSVLGYTMPITARLPLSCLDIANDEANDEAYYQAQCGACITRKMTKEEKIKYGCADIDHQRPTAGI